MPETKVADPIIATLKEADRLILERIKEKVRDGQGWDTAKLMRAKNHVLEAEIELTKE